MLASMVRLWAACLQWWTQMMRTKCYLLNFYQKRNLIQLYDYIFVMCLFGRLGDIKKKSGIGIQMELNLHMRIIISHSNIRASTSYQHTTPFYQNTHHITQPIHPHRPKPTTPPTLMSQKNFQLQLNQMKKTTLAIAIKQAIRQVGIQHQQQNIFRYLKQSFNLKFNTFRNQNNASTTMRGFIFNNYQYPIGDDDRQQYYTGLTYDAKLTGSKVVEAALVNQRKPLFLLQAYSKNQDPKKRTTSKSGKKDKHSDSVKKKVKKN